MTWKLAYGAEVAHFYVNEHSLCGVVPRSRTAEWGWQPARECRRCVRSVAKYEPEEPTTFGGYTTMEVNAPRVGKVMAP